jgi:hypothetical protein
MTFLCWRPCPAHSCQCCQHLWPSIELLWQPGGACPAQTFRLLRVGTLHRAPGGLTRPRARGEVDTLCIRATGAPALGERYTCALVGGAGAWGIKLCGSSGPAVVGAARAQCRPPAVDAQLLPRRAWRRPPGSGQGPRSAWGRGRGTREGTVRGAMEGVTPAAWTAHGVALRHRTGCPSNGAWRLDSGTRRRARPPQRYSDSCRRLAATSVSQRSPRLSSFSLLYSSSCSA